MNTLFATLLFILGAILLVLSPIALIAQLPAISGTLLVLGLVISNIPFLR